MKRYVKRNLAFFGAVAALAAGSPAGAQGDLTGLMAGLKAYRYGSNTAVLDSVVQQVAAARSNADSRRQMSSSLAGVLTSNAAFEAKQFACRQLAFIGGEEQIPALTPLLRDEQLAHYALLALARIPGPKVDAALLAELPGSHGRTQFEIMDTLGNRGVVMAVPVLTPFLTASEPGAAMAAASALAKIPDTGAADALRAAYAHAPENQRAAFGEALVDCAVRLQARGEKSTALTLFKTVDQPGSSPVLRAAVLRGMVLAQGDQGAALLIPALNEDGSRRQFTAAELVRTLPGSAATRTLSASFSKLSVQGQALLAEALGERGDVAAAPALQALCTSSDGTVRTAALRALGSLDDPSSVAALVNGAAAGSPDERAAARESLARLKSPNVDRALLQTLDKGSAAAKVEAINALGQRQAVSAAPRLLKEASGAQPKVSEAALRVLRDMGPASMLPDLVDLTLTVPADRRDRVVEAAIGVAQRGGGESRDAVVTLVRQRLASASKPADRAALLTILGQTGGNSALEALRKALADPDVEVRITAISLLSEWSTDEPMQDLLHTVQTSTDARQQSLALRGYLRLIGTNEQRTPDQQLALFRQAASLVKQPEEKRLLLAGLGKVKAPGALKYAAGFLSDNTVRGEAELAVTEIGEATLGAFPDLTRSTLNPIAKSGSNEAARARAIDILARLDKVKDFVTAWEVSPAYQQDGATYKELFDIAFSPEKPGDQKEVAWRLMPVATSAEQPWLLDLLALYPGEQKVAYLRTEIWTEAERDLSVELGSDDGVKAWWNDQVIVADNTARAVAPGQEKAKVHAKSGWNRLLLKVTQNNQGWGACARLTNPDGTHPEGLRYRVLSVTGDVK